MAIQNRRGAYADFDPTKMVAGEFAVVQTGDPNADDGKAVYMAFSAGSVKRLATYEDMQQSITDAIEGTATEIVEDVIETEITPSVTLAETAATNAAASASAAAESARTLTIDNTLTHTGQAADAKKTGDEIGALKEDLNNVFTEPLTWVQGALHVTYGNTTADSDTTVVRTSAFYKFDPIIGFRVSVPEGYKMRAYGYSTNVYTSYTGSSEYETDIITSTMLPGESTFVRFALRRTDSGEITPATAPRVELDKISLDSKGVSDIIERPTRLTPIWEQGRYKPADGRGQGSSDTDWYTKCARTKGEVLFRKRLTIVVPDGYKMMTHKYRGLTASTYVASSDWQTGTIVINDTYNNYKFTIAKTDETTLSASDVNALNVLFEAGMLRNVLTPLSINPRIELNYMLCTYKKVYITAGDFIFDNALTVFDNSEIIGSGFDTKIRLADGVAGAVFVLGSGVTIKDLQIIGRDIDYVLESDDPDADVDVVPSTMGDRHGIEITGGKLRGTIDNVYIHGFSGYGIYAHENAFAADQGFSIVNSYFCKNHGGIFLRRAEFFRIVGCDMNRNYIGMFNTGGNNNVSNCNMSANMIGISMDGTDGLSLNDTHGGIHGCQIQHSRIHAVNIAEMVSGEVFDGCNIDEGGVNIVHSTRMGFFSCNFLGHFTINVDHGGLVMFANCMMRDYTENHVTITDNTAVKFINCYKSNGNEFAPVLS